MTNVLLVRYDDPVDGMPQSYPRDAIPKIGLRRRRAVPALEPARLGLVPFALTTFIPQGRRCSEWRPAGISRRSGLVELRPDAREAVSVGG